MKPAPKVIKDGDECCRYMRATYGPRALLAFSRGKDSIAAWLHMRQFFDEIVPLFWYLIPDLEFELESLDYFERFFGTTIHRMPNPNLNRMLNAYVFQPPEHCAVIDGAELPQFKREDTWDDLCHDLGIPVIPNATGVRAADSPMRRMSYDKYGLIRPASRSWMPIGDWNKARTMDIITQSGCELPADYAMFNRSFDGIDYRFIAPLKKHRPRDYQKVLDWFPMVEAEMFRYEQMGFRP